MTNDSLSKRYCVLTDLWRGLFRPRHHPDTYADDLRRKLRESRRH